MIAIGNNDLLVRHLMFFPSPQSHFFV
jgi:hypothetical protein